MASSTNRYDFPTTNWSMVEDAAGGPGDSATDTLDQLLRRYLPVLGSYLTTTWSTPENAAKDYLQSFVADKVIRDELFAKADRNRGRFRDLLVTALDRFIISQHRREKARRRSPGQDALISLDEIDVEEISGHVANHSAFDVLWAQNVIQETLRRIEENCRATGRTAYWDIFYRRVVQPHLENQSPVPYEKIITELGFTSPLQASNALLTVKRMFARTFREVIKDYVTNTALVETEIQEIRNMLETFVTGRTRKRSGES